MKEKLTLKNILIAIPIVVVSIIAFVGFVKAPSKASDHLAEDLQKEFNENQKLIEKNQKNNAQETVAKEEKLDPRITFIGDSVMLGAVPSMLEVMPEAIVDAKESRQVAEAVDIIKGIESEDRLGGTVIIELGINSFFSKDKGQEVIDALGKKRNIYWVTVYGKYLPDQERTNGVIQELAKDNKNVQVIRWDVEAEKHPEWFYNDGIHLNGEGRKGFAQVMCDALGIKPAEPEETATPETDVTEEQTNE